ncbi:hypothetical protein ZOD2009_16051 [Haladaptatus paucihalophilus DX253]|uniref:Uncharacterized protein n=1 Tax=Haladaptatus paucihalophilus DX253 TaxID=797209 RepID=E7QWM2_HALPU|nr:hypothetical protein ZOD2009_16051 [Haladaptatus paucihalophilus DX253]
MEQFCPGERFNRRFQVTLTISRDQKRLDPVAFVGVEGVLKFDSANVRDQRPEVVDDAGRGGLELDA